MSQYYYANGVDIPQYVVYNKDTKRGDMMQGDKLTLKRRRMAEGYTQQYVADKLGVHVNTYCRIEKMASLASVRTDIVVGLASLYGVSVDVILFTHNTT